MVRKRGFEPLRYCYRQPLKLVRLPVPPLPQIEGRMIGALELANSTLAAAAAASAASRAQWAPAWAQAAPLFR